eukprot:6030967-Ditylum_brightwellii.AAC.1
MDDLIKLRTNCFSSETRRSHLIPKSLGSTKPPKGLSFSLVTGSNDGVDNIINGVRSKELCSSWRDSAVSTMHIDIVSTWST